MTTKKQTRIDDNRRSIFNRDGWRCRKCGGPATQVAHGIGQDHSKKKNHNISMVQREWKELFKEVIDKRQACDIINHPLNLFSSCADCNSYFNIGNNPIAVEMKLMEIHAAMRGDVFTKAWRDVV